MSVGLCASVCVMVVGVRDEPCTQTNCILMALKVSEAEMPWAAWLSFPGMVDIVCHALRTKGL